MPAPSDKRSAETGRTRPKEHPELDAYEADILKSYDEGEWVTTENADALKKEYEAYAKKAD